jgi:hypothetical protein
MQLVRKWHKADVPRCLTICPLSVAKRTWTLVWLFSDMNKIEEGLPLLVSKQSYSDRNFAGPSSRKNQCGAVAARSPEPRDGN